MAYHLSPRIFFVAIRQTESGRNSRSDSFFLGSFVARDESPIPPTFPKTAYTLCGLFFLFTGLVVGRVSALRKRFGESFLAESVRVVPHAKRGVTRASSMRCAAPQTVKSRLSHQKTAYTLCGLFFLFTGLVVGRVSALCRTPCKPPPKACAGSNMTE